ncbi:MAG: UDP-N-acetylglucosamine 2-epimerase [Candidatus Ozemobacteraceae bacterium]
MNTKSNLPRIAVVTGSRSDWGLVSPVASALLARSQACEAILYATGNHFSDRYGRTIDRVFEQFPEVKCWDVFPPESDVRGLADAHGKLASIAAEDFGRCRPTVLIVTGDRTEMLPPAQTAAIMGIPVAHIGGGETTQGAIDERVRACLTALSTWHFVGLPEFRDRVLALGADPKHVFVIGDTALDTVLAQPDHSDAELVAWLGFVPDRHTLLVTYHSETESPDLGIYAFDALLEVLGKRSETMVFSFPNADAGSAEIIARLEPFVRADAKRRRLVASLGSRLWVALMRRVGALVGNSSSGLIEAPSFGLPAVNVGIRQAGRFRARNIIDARGEVSEIARAVEKALLPAFRDSLRGLVNPYGDGKSGERAATTLISLLEPNVPNR